MLADTQRRMAAFKFIDRWQKKGREISDTQSFWYDLLESIFGVDYPAEHIAFEKPVALTHASRIDGYISDTKVLIEQKGANITDLSKPEKQSDGAMLTPFQQAKRYASNLKYSQNPRWIVVCNFTEFDVYDMDEENPQPYVIKLSDIHKEYYRLDFLVDQNKVNIKKQYRVSKAAGDLVGKIYEALANQYKAVKKNPDKDMAAAHSLNVLCVRLVFCLYAEDAGLFSHNQFHDYMKSVPVKWARSALLELFKVLDTPIEQRDPSSEAYDFPYVNGGLFHDEQDENFEIPQFTEEILSVLLDEAAADFDWSEISPTIFGAMFESTLNPETRRYGGMHYTAVENIHKVIDPLFLNEITDELNAALNRPRSDSWRTRRLKEIHDKIASLKFFDPACGSGNFLTETYISLRRLENRILAEWEYYSSGMSGQIRLFELKDSLDIKVSINNFYGIEINDFAVAVAKTAMWIAESQMMAESLNVSSVSSSFLPLKSQVNIVCNNALRMDWETLIDPSECNYIMGNPPFVGARQKKAENEQKKDIRTIFNGVKKNGNLDYVSCWYKKAVDMMQGTDIKAALVSTNSITQGEQVAILWNILFAKGAHIDFAYRTFRWDSEAHIKAHVHCVIIGFSCSDSNTERVIYEDQTQTVAENINPYLIDFENILVESRTKPICKVKPMKYGNLCGNTENFILEPEQKDAILVKEPTLTKFIKPYVGADEYINGLSRYCFWLVDATPAEISHSSELHRRVKAVREYRSDPDKPVATQKKAITPHLFFSISQPDSEYLLIPRTSSGDRDYVPMSFETPDIIASDACVILPNASLYDLGILTSRVHMTWLSVIGGRLKSDYRYSKDVVYNNFPWPTVTDAQVKIIEKTAQGILDARNKYLDGCMADIYDKDLMPADLRNAHAANDKAVMKAYGFRNDMTEYEIIVELLKLYQKLTEQ